MVTLVPSRWEMVAIESLPGESDLNVNGVETPFAMTRDGDGLFVGLDNSRWCGGNHGIYVHAG